MTKRGCGSCIFWTQEYEDGRGRMGKCHFHPPRYDPQQGSVFPLTAPNDWCGRFVAHDTDPEALLGRIDMDVT